MVDNTLALQVKTPGFDLSTPLLKAYQLRNAQQENELGGLKLEAGKARQSALSAYSMAQQAGEKNPERHLAGQPDIMAQVIQTRATMAEADRKAFDDRNAKIAMEARGLLPLADTPEFPAAWQSAIDRLYNAGAIDEQRYNEWRNKPSKLQLNQVLAMTTGLEGYIKTQNLQMGKAGAEALAAATSAPTPASVDLPRGLRNNNPLNIEAGPFAQRQPGFKDSDGRFARFETPEQGLAAADNLLQVYGRQGIDTLEKVINRWAPATENNVPAYVEQVSKAIGVKPGDKIDLSDPATRAKLIDAMGQVENGQPIRPGTTLVGGPANKALLTRIAATPGMPKEIIDVASKYLDKALTAEQPTPDQKDYQFSMRQRQATGQPIIPFDQWDAERSKSRKTEVNIGDRTVDKGLGERYLKAEDAGINAAVEARQYEQLDRLLDDPNVYTGTAAGPISELKKFGVTLLGLDLKGVPNAEVAKKITDEIALSYKKKAADPQTSNYERQIYERMSPSITDSAAGRKLLIAMRRADLEHTRQQAEVWRSHRLPSGEIDAAVFSALANLEDARRKELGKFMETMGSLATSVEQPAPTAGTAGALDQLYQKYKGLEPRL